MVLQLKSYIRAGDKPNGLLDFETAPQNHFVHEAYLSIVKQARRPEFYATGGAIVLTGASLR